MCIPCSIKCNCYVQKLCLRFQSGGTLTLENAGRESFDDLFEVVEIGLSTMITFEYVAGG
jgi:hypothetical protein